MILRPELTLSNVTSPCTERVSKTATASKGISIEICGRSLVSLLYESLHRGHRSYRVAAALSLRTHRARRPAGTIRAICTGRAGRARRAGRTGRTLDAVVTRYTGHSRRTWSTRRARRTRWARRTRRRGNRVGNGKTSDLEFQGCNLSLKAANLDSKRVSILKIKTALVHG
jgi:hypothetical protein